MRLEDLTIQNVKEIIGRIEREMQNEESYEEASQVFCEKIFNSFNENIILVRVFLTVPFEEIPKENKAFVNNLLGKKANLLKPETKILSLVGSKGVLPEWDSRLNSKGHIGIPLISREFIHEIPMMNRVLNQIGISFGEDINRNSQDKSFSGIFYVNDSKSEVDELGRYVITNQKFVEEYGIRTVFGFGGAYLNHDDSFTAIIFLKDNVKMGAAENLGLTATNFKIATKGYLESRRIFND